MKQPAAAARHGTAAAAFYPFLLWPRADWRRVPAAVYVTSRRHLGRGNHGSLQLG